MCMYISQSQNVPKCPERGLFSPRGGHLSWALNPENQSIQHTHMLPHCSLCPKDEKLMKYNLVPNHRVES